MIDHSLVTAVVVTRGDVDLQPILASLPFDDLIVWDNSEKAEDAKVYGRYLAAEDAVNDVVYFQDDDLIFPDVLALLDVYEPGRITCNMPSPWYECTGYERARCGMVGAGALVPKGLWRQAFDQYLGRWPLDDDFLNGCDWVNGILTPHARYDFGYEIIVERASAPGRIGTSPDGPALRQRMMERAVALRDE